MLKEIMNQYNTELCYSSLVSYYSYNPTNFLAVITTLGLTYQSKVDYYVDLLPMCTTPPNKFNSIVPAES